MLVTPKLHHNFVVIPPMIMNFSTDIKLNVLYTMITKIFVTSLLLRNYDVITCILANERSKFQMLVTPKTFIDLAEIWYSVVFMGACVKY